MDKLMTGIGIVFFALFAWFILRYGVYFFP